MSLNPISYYNPIIIPQTKILHPYLKSLTTYIYNQQITHIEASSTTHEITYNIYLQSTNYTY
jgi:hypothetical protein